MKSRRSAMSGVGLIDALIAMAILAFGLLALTRFQGRMVAQTTEVQSRSAALQLASELMSTAMVDPDNIGCYTVPAAGACARAAARANTDAWSLKVGTMLPGTVTSTSTVAGTRLTVVIGWTGKDSSEARQLTAVTDVQ